MLRTDDHLRVRVERGVRWVREQYRNQGAQALVDRARSAATQLLRHPALLWLLSQDPAASRSALVRESAGSRDDRDGQSQDVLATMCAGVALRDLNLVDSILARLEEMEAKESDPVGLAQLYRLDHLATRLRRNAENLRILAGHDAGSAIGTVTSLIDVLRAAMSAVEQYTRIEIGRVAALAVVDFAADDVSRLLAELLDNATAQSPPTSKVTVSAHLTEQGSILLRIEDSGIGLPEGRLEALNRRLMAPPRLDRAAIEHMGLAVVQRLAGKHGIRVRLTRRATHGTIASVLLPVALVCESPATPWFSRTPTNMLPQPPTSEPARSRSAGSPAVADDQTGAALATTPNGLPRRVPQSMRDFDTSPLPATSLSPDRRPDSAAERTHLVDDLAAFSDGEQAAREARDAERSADPAQGPRQ